VKTKKEKWDEKKIGGEREREKNIKEEVIINLV